ncbi:MAG TPA: polysaccharide biosynthesis protein [Leucothrix mucor]|uniref:Polysaccharide biosynthesis protein n=1 Tax=Leucothrix mucor TaxID=45248 RepID=A0A7V2SZ72_LEUMU|nr:polysaccharide biosynthesis protein [Leucothrix mucor]
MKRPLLQILFSLPRWQKRAILMIADFFLIPLALWASFALRLSSWNPDLNDGIWLLLIAPLVSIPVFIYLGLYRAVIRFMSNHALTVVLIGVSVSTATIVVITLFAKLEGIPRSVFIIYFGVAFLFIGGSRYLIHRYYHAVHNNRQCPQVAIYGAGMAGVQLARALVNNIDFRPVLFLDDNTTLHKSFISGLKVYSPDEISTLIERYQIKEILISMPSLSISRRKDIINRLEHFPVHIRTVPDLVELNSGQSKLEEIREIEIGDLLGRAPVTPDPVLLAHCIRGKNIMVTGAGGSIGSELCRQIVRAQPKRLVLFERSEYNLYKLEQELLEFIKQLHVSCELIALLGSIINVKRVSSVLNKFKVHTLYHAAAYKHVPLVEHNPVEGIENNVLGTFLTAKAALEAELDYFVFISTDKAVRPTNVMGASKRLAELGIQAIAQRSKKTRFCMVRFGNVLGSSGSVVPLFRKQIHAGGPVTVTHRDMIRYFMTIPEAAQLVIQAGAMSKGGEVFLLDMGEPVKILDLATQMIHLTGLTVKDKAKPDGDIVIEFTGLRPGEKLYEELLIDAEAQKTSHPRVFQANEKKLDWDVYQQITNELRQACEQQNKKAIYAILSEYVSGYKQAG